MIRTEIRTWKSSSRTRRFGDLTRRILETILYWKIQHFPLRLSPKMSQNAAPATKSHNPPSVNTAPATKTHTPPSPLTAPATKKNALYSSLLYSLLASILSTASILSGHLFSLGIYSLLASILSMGIYSLWASILSWHLFSTHLFSLGIYSL